MKNANCKDYFRAIFDCGISHLVCVDCLHHRNATAFPVVVWIRAIYQHWRVCVICGACVAVPDLLAKAGEKIGRNQR